MTIVITCYNILHMEQTVINIGNSAGIIIPQKILKASGIKPGDKVIVEKKDNSISIAPVKKIAGGVDARFMKVVDEFIEEHEDVLRELSNR